MRDIDTLTLQHELRRSQFALDRCTTEQKIQMYRLYIKDLATELLYRYRQGKLQEST
jgi:hypothetical protein